MRIVHLSYAHMTDFGDPELWLKQIDFFVALLEEQAKGTMVKSIHCINYSGILKRNGVEYHFLKRNKFQFLFPRGLHEYVDNLDPEIIIIHGLLFPWQVLWLRWKLDDQVRIVVQHHAEKPLRHYKRILQKLVDRFVSAYFFTSFEQARDWVQEKQIRKPERIYEIMEVPSVFYPIDKQVAKAKTKVSTSKVYLWVGRFDENKDPMTLIKAFIMFVKSNALASLYVVYQRNELIEEVKKLISGSPEVAARITLIGKVNHDELLYWFNSADFVISTSHYEGSGIAVCEAMSCGCIPVLTDIPSFRMMTANGKCGLLFRPGNVDDLWMALTKSDKLNIPIEREKVLHQYKENLSAEAISNKMMAVFNKIAEIKN